MTVLVSDLRKQDDQKLQRATLSSIQGAVSAKQLTQYSNRSLTEVEELQKEVANVIPAGNIVGLVMSGLARVQNKKISAKQAHSDINALMRGVETVRGNMLYGTLFAGPAAILAGYQKMLSLVGRDVEDAFPDGVWQFYLEFALREDSARHTNETNGFQKELARRNITLSESDQLSAWVCALSQLYFQYEAILGSQWREQIGLTLLRQAAPHADLPRKRQAYFKRLHQTWVHHRPYRRKSDTAENENYVAYRQRRFDRFFKQYFEFLPEAQQKELLTAFTERAAEELEAYQKQMSILATLAPERYREQRVEVPLWRSKIGLIVGGRYYLIPACYTDIQGRALLFETPTGHASYFPLEVAENQQLLYKEQPVWSDASGRIYDEGSHELRGYLRPAYFQKIRQQVATIIHQPDDLPAAGLDEQLLTVSRMEHARARPRLSQEAQHELQELSCAPVIINWDERDINDPLAYIRRGKRGVGDHAATIFHTAESTVFDQSHIFFDGIGGLAFAEIVTGEAASWAGYFSKLPRAKPIERQILALDMDAEAPLAEFSPLTVHEAAAEDSSIDLKPLSTLRQILFDDYELKITVNQFLVLYRTRFGDDYVPSATVTKALESLTVMDTPAANKAYQQVEAELAELQKANPSILIPLDASAVNPRDRLYPITFHNPFVDIWSIYDEASTLLAQFQSESTAGNYQTFSKQRKTLWNYLHYFGEVLRTYKRIGLSGESTSDATMRLLAHLPDSMKKLLDEIPQHVDVLNDLLKGKEVMSNVGRVAQETSLKRFISAKDDNENKTLIWGMLTDDDEQFYLTLRDFRPSVAALAAAERFDIAELITADYVRSFSSGFNQMVEQLLNIANIHSDKISERR